ncbi:hypothetical protein EPN29_05175 [bacterium]|nr:MAG: hypothetical protein EPN29_05175 [bacterium]
MRRMRRSFHSIGANMLREAKEANQEAAATGVPLDEVTDMRAERRAHARAGAKERLETYNDAARRVVERGSQEDHVDKWVAMGNLRLARSAGRDEAFGGNAQEDRVARWFASQDKLMTRRTLLKGAGAAAAGLAAAAMLGGGLQPKRVAAGGVPTIAIIGGGLAGLRCGHVLATSGGGGTPFNLYDAQGFGGRCETNRGYFLNGQVADDHGESISSEHASMLSLVTLFNLQLEDTNLAESNGRVTAYWVNGGRYTQAQVNTDWHNTYYQVIHNAVVAAPWPQSYSNHNAQGVAWDNQDVVTWMNQNFPGGSTTNFGAVCMQVIRDEYGGEPSDSSALDLTMILGYNDSIGGRGFQNNTSPVWAGTDERWHVIGGNDQIVTGLINQIPAGQLHSNVALVKINNNGSTTGPYTLTLQPQPSGSSYTVTVQGLVLCNPFKSMRSKVDLTQAGFTSLKMNAINNLGMGTSGKLFMQFNGHPWQTNGYSGVTFQDNGFISSGWEVPNNNYAGATSIWVAFPGGNYTNQILTTYGITQHEQVTPAQCITDTLAQLEPVLPGVTAAYNGKAWAHFGSNDPWVQGGYSYWRVGQATTIGGYEGVQEGYVHFGGEHTSHDFQGFMEGATTSGERCAKEIGPKG